MNPNTLDISVILTTHNRARFLEHTLALFGQLHTDDFDWEVIVVDNASTDTTPDVIKQAATRLPLVPAHEPVPGKTRAQNRALSMARGQLLVFTDDDIVPGACWLQELHAASLRWPDAGIFGGRIQPVLPESLPRWLQDDKMKSVMQRRFSYYYPEPQEGYTERHPLGPNTAIRASVMQNTRFNERLGPNGTANYIQSGDTALIEDLERQGARIVFAPLARVNHIVRPEQLTLKGLNQRAFRRGMKNAVLNPRYTGAASAFGVPLALWRGLARQWLRYVLARPFGNQIRFPIENKLAFRRGYLFQCRREQLRESPAQSMTTE